MAFKLGTFERGGRRFAGLVIGDHAVDLGAAHGAFADSSYGKRGRLTDASSVLGLLQDWDRNFAALQPFAEFVGSEGFASGRLTGAVHPLDALKILPPVIRPPKMLYAAANYREHVAGMRKTFRGGLPPIEPAKDYQADKAKSEPYLFLKAGTSLAGPHDDIVLPAGSDKIDWEAELAVVIGRPGRHIPAAKALDHVAGYMTTNDVSCRSRTWRTDRPSLRSDWLGGKSYDTFAPMGPFLVPHAFVPDHTKLRIQCIVNGITKQDGVSGDMVFGVEDQIEYASHMLTLESGDVFATGTPAGTGQERLEYLKAGDVVETEVEGLGRQRNAVIAENADYRRGHRAPY